MNAVGRHGLTDDELDAFVRDSRAAQGKPAVVTDPAVYALVADAIAATAEEAAQRKAAS